MFKQFFQWFRRTGADRELSARVKALEDRWNAIEDEWTDWYEKFRLLHLRLAKRQKAMEVAEAAESETAAVPLLDGNSGMGAGMTDVQKQWQQKILRQRARM